MTAIGIPGASRGIQKTDPTLAGVLKSLSARLQQAGTHERLS